MASNFKCPKCGNELAPIEQTNREPFNFDIAKPLRCSKCRTRYWRVGDNIPADLKFGCLHDLPRNYSTLSLKDTALLPISESFIQNMDRVLALGRMPAIFLYHFSVYLTIRDAPPEGRMAIDLMVLMGKCWRLCHL